MSNSQIVQFKNETDLKSFLAKNYQKSIENFFGDPKLALEFLSNVMASVQRTPKLMECDGASLMNAFMTMASLKLMPSGVSGEAYVLPYKGVAQFQLGYKGLVTLFYRAGARSIIAEIVHENDQFNFLNGEISHVYDPFADNRGEVKGAYVIIELQSGGRIYKAMSKKEILEIAKKFSKSYGTDFSPWTEGQDPQGWMLKKTVLKQAAKLVPQNETIYKALAADNEDSIINDRPEPKEKSEIRIVPDTEEVTTLLKSCRTPEGLTIIWADLPADAKTDPHIRATYKEMVAILGTEANVK